MFINLLFFYLLFFNEDNVGVTVLSTVLSTVLRSHWCTSNKIWCVGIKGRGISVFKKLTVLGEDGTVSFCAFIIALNLLGCMDGAFIIRWFFVVLSRLVSCLHLKKVKIN